MSDLTPESYQETAQAPIEEKPGGVKGFFSSPLGKVLLIGGAAGLLLTVLAAVALVVVLYLGKSTVDTITSEGPKAVVVKGGETSRTAEETTEPAPDPVTNSDVFAFRDPFQPLLKAKDESSGGNGSSSSGSGSGSGSGSESGGSGSEPGGSTSAGDNTLLLQDVTTEDGVPHAQLVWEEQSYSLAEGEPIPDTAWEVLSISGNSVVMLYGDERVTLSVGQGLAPSK